MDEPIFTDAEKSLYVTRTDLSALSNDRNLMQRALQEMPWDPDWVATDGRSFLGHPLFIGVSAESAEAVEVMLNDPLGIKVVDQVKKGSPLHALSWFPHTNEVCAIVDMLIASGYDVDDVDVDGKTPRELALERNMEEVLQCLNGQQ